MLTMSGILLVNIVAIFGVHEPFGISEVSFFGAVLLLGISGKGREILERLDWGILVLFAALFVLMQAVSDNGIISYVAGYLPSISAAHPAAAVSSILASSVVLSQVLSNVPMVAAVHPTYENARIHLGLRVCVGDPRRREHPGGQPHTAGCRVQPDNRPGRGESRATALGSSSS